MAKALWECDTRQGMGRVHEMRRDEGGKVGFTRLA
jgi:hypothetical protein